jgi:hypothetical protein
MGHDLLDIEPGPIGEGLAFFMARAVMLVAGL